MLKNVTKTELYKKDKEFNKLIDQAINKVCEGNNPDLEMVRLAPFLNKYLISKPSQELIDLQLFLSRASNNYRGIINITSWLH